MARPAAAAVQVAASVPAEIRIVGGGGVQPDFYDFEAKYLDDVCEFDIPAKLDDDVAERVRELAVAAFRALDGQGLARVDFFLSPNGDLTVNEINTMPGFTPISMFPRAWAVTGVDYPALLTTLVETALARGTAVGAFALALFLGQGAGSLLFGLGLGAIGYRGAFAVAGTGVLALALRRGRRPVPPRWWIVGGAVVPAALLAALAVYSQVRTAGLDAPPPPPEPCTPRNHFCW